MAGILVLGFAAYTLAEMANRDIKNRDIHEKNKNTTFHTPPDNGGVWGNYVDSFTQLSPDKRYVGVISKSKEYDLYGVPYKQFVLSNKQKVKHYNLNAY